MAPVLPVGPRIVNPRSRQAVGLRAAWPLTDAGGLTVHNAGEERQFDHTISSASTVTSVATERGMALSFTGGYTSLSSTNAEPLVFSGPHSGCVWVRGATLANADDSPFSHISASPYNGWMIWRTANTTYNLYVNGANRVKWASVALSEWHHLAWTWNGSTYQLYLDGLPGSSASYSTAPTSTGQTLYIGRYSWGASDYRGRIRDARLYGRALSAHDVRDIYANPDDLYQPEDDSWLWAALAGGGVGSSGPHKGSLALMGIGR